MFVVRGDIISQGYIFIFSLLFLHEPFAVIRMSNITSPIVKFNIYKLYN